LLSAYRKLLSDIPDAELEVVGGLDTVDHGVANDLAREFEDLGRKATVRRHGHLGFGPELFQILADADVLVLPSRSEGTPRVLIEARAFGCTVVASSVGGIPSSIENGVDGLLVPPDDPDALCTALLRVASDRQLRDRLVAGGVARVRQSSVEAFAGTIYDEALSVFGQCCRVPRNRHR
jgi:glycosyltransferase involved in cell wall biosynthesis